MKDEDKKNDLCSKKIIADLLNLTERRVEQLAARKIIPKAERGKFDLGPTVKAYIMYLQQKLSGGGSVDVNEVREEKLQAEKDERVAKARQARITAEMLEGKTISREKVEEEWTRRCIEVRSALLSLPREIGFLFSDTTQRNVIEEGVEKFVRETLERYCREGIYTPRTSSVDAEGAGGPDAAAKNKRVSVGGRKPRARSKKRTDAGTVENEPDAVS